MSVKGLPISQLIAAIREASLHSVVNALDDGCDIETADQHGLPGLPLRTACFSGNIEIVRELIQRGADVNAPGSDGPGMPLRLALRARNFDIAALLLASGAEVPPGITLPDELQPGKQPAETKALEIPALEFTPAPKESQPADFIPESHAAASPEADKSIENYQVDEEVEITSSYGLDTNMLTMDLLRFDEEPGKETPAAAGEKSQETPAGSKKAGFWKSSRNP